ncbi:MAG: hypothetical protein HY403_12675 [Elusimicrobia bacterium]|nr:hypothetical protein [Elusimicrobiota bacterium]
MSLAQGNLSYRRTLTPLALALALFSPPSAMGRKVEVELRVPLSPSGFSKLSAALAPAPELLRRDSYLDYHDGQRFVLKRLEPPYKLRVEDDGEGRVIQVSRPTAKEAVSGAGLTATVTTVESRRTTLSARESSALNRALDAFFEALPGDAPVDTLAAEAGRLLAGLSWKGRDLVEAAAPNAHPLPAARSRKERRRAAIALDDGTTLDAILGLTRALNERGRPVTLYELEAETPERDPETLRALARRLLHALRRLGLLPEDMGGPSPDAFAFAESRLRGGR